MALRFYNTLTQQMEVFTPLSDNVVKMYTCGPTVYNYVHTVSYTGSELVTTPCKIFTL